MDICSHLDILIRIAFLRPLLLTNTIFQKQKKFSFDFYRLRENAVPYFLKFFDFSQKNILYSKYGEVVDKLFFFGFQRIQFSLYIIDVV